MLLGHIIKDRNDYNILDNNLNHWENEFCTTQLVEHKNTHIKYLVKTCKERFTTERDQTILFSTLDKLIKAKHLLILDVIGVSIFNFQGEPYPMIFYQYFEEGSLYNVLKNDSGRSIFSDFTTKYIFILGVAIGM